VLNPGRPRRVKDGQKNSHALFFFRIPGLSREPESGLLPLIRMPSPDFRGRREPN